MDEESLKPGAQDAPKDRLDELKDRSHRLKERIIEQQKKSSMPMNSSLGDPAIDARNADGGNDLSEAEDE